MSLVNELRKRATTVYLAAEEGPANDLSKHLIQAADRIEELEALVTIIAKAALKETP